MVQLLNFLGACCALMTLVHCQSLRQMQNNALQDMLEYTSLFQHRRRLEPQHAPVAAPIDNTQDDPELREYKKISEGHRTRQRHFTTTTTTTQAPPVPSLPVFNIEQDSANPQPAQKRRITSRRKNNNPETIVNYVVTVPSPKPFSTPLRHITDPTLTVGRPLRQKQTTASTPIIFEEPIEELFKIDQSKSQIAPQNFHRTAPKIAFEPTPVNSEESRLDQIEFRRQAETAQYQFASDVEDGISGNLLQREEVRDGLVVRGKYSSSDGYFKRTVHYQADDMGYRIVKEEVEALDGPHTNPNGHAKVSSYVDGNSVNYEITKADIRKKVEKLRQ